MRDNLRFNNSNTIPFIQILFGLREGKDCYLGWLDQIYKI